MCWLVFRFINLIVTSFLQHFQSAVEVDCRLIVAFVIRFGETIIMMETFMEDFLL